MAMSESLENMWNNEFPPDCDEENALITQSHYYDIDDFSCLMSNTNSQNSLSILNLNCRSLVKNFNELYATVKSLPYEPGIVTMEETWLDDSLEQLVSMPGYSLITKHKISRKEGGGLGIYVNDKITYEYRDDLNCANDYQPYFDHIFIEIVNGNDSKNNILLGVFYRVPGGNTIEYFNDYLTNKLLPALSKENKQIVIVGDMNANLLKSSEHPPTGNYLDIMLNNAFLPKITVPTRVTHDKATLIDHIFVKDTVKSLSGTAGTIKSSMSDHYMNFIFLPIITVTPNIEAVTYRAFTTANVDRLSKKLNDHNFSNVYSSVNVNDAYDNFTNSFTDILNKTIPLKQEKFNKYKHKVNPWVTKEIMMAIKTRDKIHTRYTHSKCKKSQENLKYQYIESRNNVNKMIRDAKFNYHRNMFEKSKNDSKQIWKNINSIIRKSNDKSNIISKITVDDTSITNIEDICNSLNEYYVNVGPALAKTIKPQKKKRFKLPEVNIMESLFLTPTTEEEVMEIIKRLKPKSSCGHDNISSKLIKQLGISILKPLAYIMNLSFSTGSIPDLMKKAKVIPIYKNSGGRDIMKNYRPVSLLPVFSKILERLVYNRLYSFIKKHNILTVSQYGFQKYLSTELAILELQDRIADILYKKDLCAGLFMDLSKAFDTLDHGIMITKMRHYGVRGIALEWFKNYLGNREQYVSVNNVCSSNLPIQCGVPQGSILGPLLFLIYINDLAQVSPNAISILFADDTNVIYRSQSYEILNKTINNELALLSAWFNENKLALNVSKTKFMIFHLQHHKPPDQFKVFLDGTELENVKTTKFLGVMINETLSWNEHMDYIASKLSRMNGVLARLKHQLPLPIMKTIYNSLFCSTMQYGISVWGGTSNKKFNRLVTLQKKAVRHVTCAKYNSHTGPIFKKLDLLNILDTYKLQCSKILYKKKLGTLHPYHSNLLRLKRDTQESITRQSFDVIMGKSTVFRRINNLVFKVGYSWNGLPYNIKMLEEITERTFSKKVKSHYLSKYSEICYIPKCYICKI